MMRLLMLAVWLLCVYLFQRWLKSSTTWPTIVRGLMAGVLGTLALIAFAFLAGYLGWMG
jgi:hypothetical protein